MVAILSRGLAAAGSVLGTASTVEPAGPSGLGPFLLLATLLLILVPCLVGMLLLLLLGRRLRRRVRRQPVASSVPDPFWNLQSPPADNDNELADDREGDGG